jgi:hypothetical protein
MPARHVQHQNGGFVEFRSSLVYPLSTACGRPEVYIRGRFHRCTEGFCDGLDSLPSIAGLVLLAQCGPRGALFQPA